MDIIVTNAAKRRIDTAKSIQFTKIALGSGTHSINANLDAVESLYNFEMDLPINGCVMSDNKATISAQVTNSTTGSDFVLTELGLYADIDGTHLLYAYGDCSSDPQHIYKPGNNLKVMDIKLEVFTSNLGDIVVNSNAPDSLVTQEQLTQVLNSLDISVEIASSTRAGVVKPSDEISVDGEGAMKLTQEIKEAILLSAHPLGSIYISTTEQSPADLFGGKWERIKDTFLIAAGDVYERNSFGGYPTHTLTIEEMPAHRHKEGISRNTGFDLASHGIHVTSGSGQTAQVFWSVTDSQYTSLGGEEVGGGKPFSTMPPYLAVVMWKRIA